VQCGRRADCATVRDVAADHVVVATGARPAGTGFQRAVRVSDLVSEAAPPDATSIELVLAGTVHPSGRVLLLDDVGDWRGIGTAIALQEDGCTVTIVTSAPAVAGGLLHSAADVPTRRRFVVAGGELLPDTIVDVWSAGSATLRSTLTGEQRQVSFDWLVVAETPVARTELHHDLAGAAVAHHLIGDCVAPRRAWSAILEGRSVGRLLGHNERHGT